MGVTFPNETQAYRSARTALLRRELALRREMEAIAVELRALPPGGEVPEDYSFDYIGADGAPATVRLSELFRNGDSLMLYHYMFPRHAEDRRPGPETGAMAQVPLAEGPCPSCTALIDMWDGTIPHFEGLGGNLAVVAKAPIERVAAFARDKGWKHIRLLSAANNSFKRDYHGEDPEGQQAPIMTVFKRWPDGTIRLHWASELLFEPADPGQDMRHMGTVEPLWTLFDLTPGGGRMRTSRSSMTAAARARRKLGITSIADEDFRKRKKQMEESPSTATHMPVFLSPEQGRAYPISRISALFKADGAETANLYSVSEWWLEPHTQGPGAHSHPEDDVFYLLEGTMSFLIGERGVDAPKGSFVLVPGGTTHDFENRVAQRGGVLNFSTPGNFEPQMPEIVRWFAENPPGPAGTVSRSRRVGWPLKRDRDQRAGAQELSSGSRRVTNALVAC